MLYQTLVQSILLYNAETWTLLDEHKSKLEVFETSVYTAKNPECFTQRKKTERGQ